MKIKKFLTIKTFFILFLLGALGFSIWYYQLSNRHQAIVKTEVLHFFHWMDADWEIENSENLLSLRSPDLLVDDIYESMDGPQSILNVNMNPDHEPLRWITGFRTEVMREGETKHNNDYLCHTNVDFFDAIHFRNLNIPERMALQYPRLTTLSNGINDIRFPEGFGFPVPDNEKFIVASRTLNHNIEDPFFKVKHNIDFFMESGETKLRALNPKAVVLLRDYDHDDPDNPDFSKNPALCLPLDLKNHKVVNKEGKWLSSHWVLPKGKDKYEFDITYQLYIFEDTTVHAMAAHLHPFATAFSLVDATTNETLFTFNCDNYDEKRGLKHVPVYSSAEGILLKGDHDYKLVLETDNPTDAFSDMMAVLFLYLADTQMDEHLSKTYYSIPNQVRNDNSIKTDSKLSSD